MPQPLAKWNPDRGVWETAQPCLFGLSEPYSEGWPTSGTTRAGMAYSRPMWGLLTPDSGSSSSPGLLGTPRTSSANGVGQYEDSDRGTRGRLEAQVDVLLKTPNANLASNGGSQHPEKRKEGGHGPTLADEVEHLLPTPRALVARLLPTPTATDSEASGGSSDWNVTLTDATVRTAMGTRPNPRHDLLPTPMTRDYRTGYRDGKAAPGRIGSPPLNDVVQLLPSPDTASGPHGERGSRSREALARGDWQTNLSDVPTLIELYAESSGDPSEEPSSDGRLF